MLPLLPLAMGAISLGKGLFGRHGQSPRDKELADYRNRFSGAVTGLGNTAGRVEDDYLNGLEGFDPESAFSAKTTADLDAYDDDFGRSYASKLGGMVGAGRSPSYSGFGVRDAQQTIRQGQQDRARIRTQNSDALAGMQLSRLGQMGNYASGARNLYMDAISGRMNTLEGDQQADAASRRGLWGSLAGAGATAAGAYFGGRTGRK